MKVVLIRAPEHQLHDDRLDVPMGLVYLAGALRRAGHEPVIVDLAGARPMTEIPFGDIYGISAFTTSYHVARQILGFIREREPSAVIVGGGPHVSAVGDQILDDGFDYAFVGEGEVTFPKIVERLAKRQVLSRVIQGEEPASLDDLDFDYDLVDFRSYTRTVNNEPCATFLSARGCPYKCRFCWTPNNLGASRFHSSSYIEDVLDRLEHDFGCRAITFHDDSFLADAARAAEIMQILRERAVAWRAECNLLHLKPEMCEQLAAAGCRHILTGVETGSPAMLKAMKKPQSQSTIARGIENAVAAGLTVRASLIVGFPGETWETVKESTEFLCGLPFQEYSLYNFTPFPGTEPFDFPERFGIEWISPDYEDFYLLKGYNEANYCYRTASITPDVLREWRAFMIAALDERHTASVRVEGSWRVASEK